MKAQAKEGFENGFVPNQIFNAVLHSAFSAASELRTLVHSIRRIFSFIT
jgi:hypothetical protein